MIIGDTTGTCHEKTAHATRTKYDVWTQFECAGLSTADSENDTLNMLKPKIIRRLIPILHKYDYKSTTPLITTHNW